MSNLRLGFDEIGIGGALTLSCVAREIKRVSPNTRIDLYSYHPELFRGNPHIVSNNYFTDAPCRNIHSPEMLDQDRSKHFNYYYCMDMGVEPVDIHPELYLSKNELTIARMKYDLPKKFVVLHAQPSNIHRELGRDSRWTTTKDWYLERWEEVVANTPLPVYQVRVPEEPYIHGCIDTVGTTVRDACSIISMATLLLGCVSYSMHVASATNTKAVIIYGARELPYQTGYPDRHICITSSICEGGPCYLVGDCKLDRVCMDKIHPEHVVSAMGRILEGTGNDSGIIGVR